MGAGSIRTNETRFTARDETGAAFNSLLGRIKATGQGFDGLKASLLGLGVGGLTVGAFGAIVKHMLEVADETGKAAQKAGMATEEFSKWQLAAKLAGVETAQLVKGIKGLSDMMVKATDATSQQATILAKLGVDARGSVNDALLKVADTFKQLPDGAVKTALAVALFGKAGMDMIPMLNAGAEGLQKVKREAELFGVVVREDTAKASEQLNDNLKLLGMSSEALGIKFANAFAPALATITERMKEAYLEGGKLESLLVGLGGLFKLAFTDEFTSEADKAARDVRRLTKELADLRALNAQPSGFLDTLLGADLSENIGDAERALFAAKQRLVEITRADEAAAAATRRATEEQKAKAKAVEEEWRKTLALGAEREKLAKQGQEEVQRLKERGEQLAQQLQYGRQLTESEKLLASIAAGKFDKYGPALKNIIKAQAEHNQGLEKEIQLRADAAKMLEQYVKGLQAEAEIKARNQQVADDAVAAFDADIAQAQFELSLIGKSQAEIAKLTEIRRIDLQVRREIAQLPMDEEGGQDPQAVLRIIAAGERAKQMLVTIGQQSVTLREQAGLWDDVAGRAGNFFADLVTHGRGAFDRLKDSLKSFAAELLAMMAKRWVLNIAANMVGGSTGQQLMSLAGNVGQGSGAAGSVLNLLGGAGGLWGSSAAYGAALGTTSIGAGSQAAMLAAQTAEFGAEGLALTSSAAGGASGGIMSSLASLGPYLAAAAALYGLYKAFAPARGGPKEGGGFFGTFTGDGALASGSRGSWYGGVDTHNSTVQQMVTTTGQAIGRMIAQFGGTSSGFGLNFGYDTDPKGTAQNRLRSALVDASGATVYAANYDFARGDPSAQLQLEMSKMMVAAIQNSNIQKEIKALFDGFDLSGATQQSIDELMKQAEELSRVLALMAKGVGSGITVDSLKAMQVAGETLDQTMQRVADGMGAIAAVSGQETDTLAAYEKALGDMFAAIGMGVPSTVEAWRSLAATIDLSTEAGRALFNVMAQGAGTFQQVQQAVQSAIAGIWSSAQSVFGGQFGATFARSRLESTYAQWQAMRGENFSWEQMLGHFAQYATNPGALAEGIEATRQQYGAAGVQLLNQLFADYSAYMSALNQGTQTLTNSVTTATGALDDFAGRLANAQNTLADQLRGSLFGALSPLSVQDQYQQAQQQFNAQLALADQNNPEAIAGIFGYWQNLLGLSRQVNGSNAAYNNDYFTGFNRLAGYTAGQVAPLTSAVFVERNALVVEELQQLRESNEAGDQRLGDAIAALAAAVMQSAAGETVAQATIDRLTLAVQRLGGKVGVK